MIEFNIRTKTLIGKDAILGILPYLEEHGLTRVGLMVDQALSNHPSVAMLKDKLGAAEALHVAVDYVYDLKFEPDYDSLDRVKQTFKSGETPLVDVIVAIGGGSVIDFAKGIATVVTNHEPAISYRGFPKGIHASVPVIAVPTTAGTASEVTFNAVFIDYKDNKKLGINTHNNFPVVAVLDPEMTRNAPYSVNLSSGLDALVHTIESFAAPGRNNITRMFAVEAFRLLFNNLKPALTEPENEMARQNMLVGAYLAGVSLMNAGSGPSGAISYALGVVNKVPHGLAGGMTLPYLVEHNVSRQYDEYAVLYDQIEGASANLSAREKSEALVQAFFALWDELDVWAYALRYDVKVDEDTALQQYLSSLQGAYNQNPLPFVYEDAVYILNKIYG